MINIKGIDHIVLKTNKLEEMTAFYCDILGCTVERTQEAFHLVQLRAGDNLIDLLGVEEDISADGRNMAHFCLRVSPFDYQQLKAYLDSHNIEVDRYGERYSSQGLGWSFYLKDPQGNEIELTEAK